jgi:hypothetical protein
MARRRHPKPGTLADLQRVLWAMIRRVERLSDDAEPEQVLRCAHALSQLSGSYRSVIEGVNMDQRIRALEMAVERNGHAKF